MKNEEMLLQIYFDKYLVHSQPNKVLVQEPNNLHLISIPPLSCFLSLKGKGAQVHNKRSSRCYSHLRGNFLYQAHPLITKQRIIVCGITTTET